MFLLDKKFIFVINLFSALAMISLVSLASNPTDALKWISAELASFMPAGTIEWEYVETLKQAQQLIKEGKLDDLKEIDERLKSLEIQNLFD